MGSPAPLRLRTPPGLLPDARHVVLPEGIVSSGGPGIIAACAKIGITLDPWQVDVCSAMMGKTSAGTYAADMVVLSIPRQVGKTFLVGAVTFADCIAVPGTLVVWTAHRFKVSRESFDELRALAERPEMRAHIDPDAITTAAGNEVIPFRNGSRIVFAARERGSIRGFRKVRRLVLDEAQILSDAALSDLGPTQNQAVNPQLVLMGTPPKPSDPSEAFLRLRAEAMSGEAEGMAYVEFSAEPGSDPDDRGAWRIANPSYPFRTPERAILRLRRLLDSEDFMREVMGVWTAGSLAAPPAIDPAQWAALISEPSERSTPSFGVAVAPDRLWSALAVAWLLPSGDVWGEIVDYRPDAGWLTDRTADLARSWGGTFTSSTSARGIVLGAQEPGPAVQAQAHNGLADRVAAGTFRHAGQPETLVSVRESKWRPYGDSRIFDRRGSKDITPLDALALAVAGVVTAPPPVPVALTSVAPAADSFLSMTF